ncbi:MAG: hypothetical protein MUF28_07280 [Ignavibacterium sp.]|jgi:hypothetical protein|nr:hypothetical protein [Ignavibacterium sp.]
MKNSFVLAVLVSLIFSLSHSYSQGIFLEKGEAGFFAGGSYSSLENGHSTSFGGGFALGGVMELGYTSSTSKIKLEMYGLGNEVEVNSQTVSLGVVLLKKKAQLEVNIGYTTSSENSSSLESSDAVLLGFNVGSEIKLHEMLSWYPVFSFAVGIPIEEDSGNPATALGLTAPILLAEHVYLGPTVSLSEGDLNWGFTAGVLISFNTSNAGGW